MSENYPNIPPYQPPKRNEAPVPPPPAAQSAVPPAPAHESWQAEPVTEYLPPEPATEYRPPVPAPEYRAPVPAPAYRAPAAAKRKGFPLFSIPALVMLALMLFVFFLEVYLSLHKVSVRNIWQSVAVGMDNFIRYLSSRYFPEALGSTLVFRAVQLGGGALLAAGLCAIYYAMKKPRVLLTFACLWLIPACLPFLSTWTLFRGTLRTDYSGTLTYLLTSVLQTASLFCFIGGLFAFLNLRKKGKTGGGPYYGLLVGVLAFLFSSLTAFATGAPMYTAMSRGMSLDMLNVRVSFQNANWGTGAAGGVVKVLGQVLLAIVPLVVLSILARKKSTKGKTPWMVLWVFIAFVTFVPLVIVFGSGNLPNGIPGSTLATLSLALAGGCFGGLLAYSFVHLLRRVPAFLFGVIAVVLAAALSCVTSEYISMRSLGVLNTLWPQIFLSVFDPRLVLVTVVLAFALRDYTEAKPGSLVLAFALLSAALLWGEFSNAYLYSQNLRGGTPLTMLIHRLFSTASYADLSSAESTAVITANMASRQMRTVAGLLLAFPPLLLGAGAGLFLKRALAGPKKALK